MKRRIVIYENKNGNGEQIAHFENEINKYNNILERDLAAMILAMEKDPNLRINPMLVVKYITVNKKKFSPLVECINMIMHPEDFKQTPREMPKHILDVQEKKQMIRNDLNILRM